MAGGDGGTEGAWPAPVIVGIGASADRVQALRGLFDLLPATTGAVFVVIAPLGPDAHGNLPALLASSTTMPVVQLGEREPLLPDRIYLVPPDRHLELSGSHLSAVASAGDEGRRQPIDRFFRALAAQGDGVAVILTGAGSDGALGARAIREAGGIILAQDPDEATYQAMPGSPAAAGLADLVLPIRELAAQLTGLIRGRGRGLHPAGAGADEELVRQVLAHLRADTGHDFSRYKRSTVLRRIARRMQVTRSETLNAYLAVLRERAEETQALLGDLLISVTAFFRDRDAFETLKAQVLPQLFRHRAPGASIRIWVPGCATGEEAYSIAILLIEEAVRHGARPHIQILASDLDARALAIARDGIFPPAIEADVGEERLQRFFRREANGFRVCQEVRDLVLFTRHDLLKDPPFTRLDLISCRNLLIYFDRGLQEQVLGTFHYALNPGGVLMLGTSETAENPPGLFTPVDRPARIYRSVPHQGERPRLSPRLMGIRQEPAPPQGPQPGPGSAVDEAATHRRAIDTGAPPSILVDEAHRVLHLSEHAGRFIEPSGGPLNSDLIALVRSELRFELRSALHRAFDQHLPTLSLPIPVRFDGRVHRVLLHVQPIPDRSGRDRPAALVTFLEGAAVEEDSPGTGPRESGAEAVRRLTEELALTQARLRTVREESEAANEELRAANEELQSINEEYRSTSEELETSKEELQSINEELQTVNGELKLKLEAVSRAHSDLQNLMAATDVGTLFLDSALRIKRFTDRLRELFSVTPSDEGRPITDFAHRLDYDGLVADARGVLATLAPIRREIRSRNGGRWYEVRLRPYRTLDDKIDGVVVTFVDVTERRQVEEALRASQQQLQQQKALVELSRAPIFVWDFDGGIVEWNRGSEELYGYTRTEALGRRKEQLLKTEVPGSSFEALCAALETHGSWTGELRQTTKSGRSLVVESRIEMEYIDGRRLVLESTRDVTDKNEWERRQQLLLGELTHRVKNTLAVVQSIAQQTLRSAPSGEEFVERFSGRLAALASAHGLLVQSDWKGADFRALAENQLAPHISENRERLRLNGGPVVLAATLATPVGLVLHELATNAAKYGSLSVPGGQVALEWTVLPGTRDADPQILHITWAETGGPPPVEGAAAGFGTILIERGIPEARVTRAFRPTGLVCTFEIPLRQDAGDGSA